MAAFSRHRTQESPDQQRLPPDPNAAQGLRPWWCEASPLAGADAALRFATQLLAWWARRSRARRLQQPHGEAAAPSSTQRS